MEDDGYDWNDYASDMVEQMIPYAVLAGVALLLFVLSAMIWCFKSLFSCCCKCCRNKNRASSKFMLNICVLTSFLLVAGVLVCIGLSVNYVDNSFQSYMQAECATYKTTYTLKYGTDKSSDNWVGLSEAIDDFELVRDELAKNYVYYTEKNWKGTDWLTLEPENLKASLAAYYAKHANDKILSPNPRDAEGTTLTPSYVNNLGPTTDGSTYTGKILTEMNKDLFPTIVALKSLKEVTILAESQVDDAVLSLQYAIDQLTEFEDDVNEIEDHIKDWFLDYEDEATMGWKLFTLACVILGWLTLLILLLTLCIVSLHTYKAAKLFCCGWLAFALIGVLTAVLCAMLAGGSYVTSDSCDFSSELITTEGLCNLYIDKYDYLIPETAAMYLDVCFNQDGDLIRTLHLEQLVATIELIVSYYNFLLDLDITYDSLTKYDSVQENQDKIDNIRETYTSATDDTISEDQRASTNLNELNSWSNYNYEDSNQVIFT